MNTELINSYAGKYSYTFLINQALGEPVFEHSTGGWQGTDAYIFEDNGQYGFLYTQYGSCSHCDYVMAINQHGDGGFASACDYIESLPSEVRWFDDASHLLAWVCSEDAGLVTPFTYEDQFELAEAIAGYFKTAGQVVVGNGVYEVISMYPGKAELTYKYEDTFKYHDGQFSHELEVKYTDSGKIVWATYERRLALLTRADYVETWDACWNTLIEHNEKGGF